ncbi:hypothetical protein H0H93_005515 [Arthromyces matolae]|nr:hypothetical protein H0H93_005515 [Arthromyces matolae]
MFSLQDGSNSSGFSSLVDLDMDHIWQSFINDDVCTSEMDTSPTLIDTTHPVHDEPSNVFSDMQFIADLLIVPAVGDQLSRDDLFSLSSDQSEMASSPSSDSTSSFSRSPSLSPRLYPSDHQSQEFNAIDFGPASVYTRTGGLQLQYPVLCQPSPLPPISTPSRSVRCPSPSGASSCSSASSVHVRRVIDNSSRRSLRPRGPQQSFDVSSDLSEDDYGTPYTSDISMNSGSRRRRRGAPTSYTQAKILRQIQRDTSMTSCPSCCTSFSRHADVVRHYLSVHYIKTEVEILNDTSHKRLHCLGCNKILSRKDSRERHESVCPVYCEQRGLPPNPLRAIEGKQRRRLVAPKNFVLAAS